MAQAPNQPTTASTSLSSGEQTKPDFEKQLDYQLKLDKERMDIQHKNKKRELWWDKGIFALVLAIAGGIVGCVGYWLANKSLENQREKITLAVEENRAKSMKELEKDRAKSAKAVEKDRQEEARKLEEFRTKEAGRRSLLEKQLPELFKINGAISKVTRLYFLHSGGHKVPDEQKVRDEYKEALDEAREAINRSTFLFDLDFNKDLDRYYAVHSKMSKLSTEKWGKYQDFAFDLSNKFDDLCKSVVEGDRGDPKTRIHMPLSPIGPSEREQLSPEQCLDVYHQYWKDKQARH